MPRGLSFSQVELNIMNRAFARDGGNRSQDEIYDEIKRRLIRREITPRPYLSYWNKYRTTRNNIEEVPRIVLEPLDLTIINGPSTPTPATPSSPQYVPTTTPTSTPPAPKKKRTVADMNLDSFVEEDLEKLEEKIKVRRVEIENESKSHPTCGICHCENTINVIATCDHVFCVQCYISNTSRALPNPYQMSCHVCPVCRAEWNKPNDVKFMEPNSTIADCKKFIAEKKCVKN